MKKATTIILFFLVQAALLVCAQTSVVAEISAVSTAMRGIAAAMAVLLFSLQGLKWITSEGDADRAEAKKGMIYVALGLVVVYVAAHMVCGLYGVAIGAYGITCSLDTVNFRCSCS